MFKQWLINIFWGRIILLENILSELKNLHYHIDRMESFYILVNNIKVEGEKIIDKNPES